MEGQLDKINKLPTINKVSKDWYDGNVFKTDFLHALSSLFPGGELYFLRSLNHFSSEVPNLKEELRIFSIQEGNHTKGHRILNRKIDELYGNKSLQSLEEITDELLRKVSNRLSPELNLIITEALEHITYHLCESILERQDVLDTASTDAKELFIYHCIEETGDIHSSISSKVVSRVIKRIHHKLIRKFAITPVAAALLIVLFYHLSYITRNNNNSNTKEILKGLNDLFGFEGWVREGLQKSIKTWRK